MVIMQQLAHVHGEDVIVVIHPRMVGEIDEVRLL